MCEFTQDSWEMYRYTVISDNIIKEMPGSVASGTPCITVSIYRLVDANEPVYITG